MINWLKNRLSPNKNKSERWLELSEALEQTWEDQFSVPFDAVATLRSIYTADEAGQRRKLAEYGKRYEKYLDPQNLAVTLALRKMEMLQKDTALPTELLILRVLGSKAINPIKPLYALSEDNYGQSFYTLEQLAEMGISVEYGPIIAPQIDGTWKLTDPTNIKLGSNIPFLTSRVAMVIDLSDLKYDMNMLQVKDDFNILKPLHVVFQGIMYQMYLDFAVQPRQVFNLSMEKNMSQHMRLRLDGVWKLDGFKKIKSFIDGNISVSKSIDIDFTRFEKLGKPLKALGNAEGKRLDGSWNIGGSRLNGSWQLSGVKKLSSVCLGRAYSKTKLDGSWWLGTTRHLDGGWKLGGTLKTVTAEAQITIRKGIQ